MAKFECKDMLLKCPSKYKDDPNIGWEKPHNI